MMSHLDLLPEPTKALWLKLRDEPLLKGGILIGGTALTLRTGHRISEDLDFAFLSERLPISAINLLLRKYPDWIRNDNLDAYEEFLVAGQSLHDYQQDFVSGDGVKLTFLAEEKRVWSLLDHTADHARPLRVATTKEIFGLKCLVSAKRSKSRDAYDLYVLFEEHGFSISDMAEAFERTNQPSHIDIAFRRLCSGITAPDDEGYEALIESPPSKETLKAYFQGLRDRYEIEQSRILRNQ
jgi:predicted nucleotidyltransferase component of viral defense system